MDTRDVELHRGGGASEQNHSAEFLEIVLPMRLGHPPAEPRLSGPHAWKNSGGETARVLFLYTPAAAGGYVEEMLHRPGPMSDDERKELRERYRWEVVGPNPL